MTRRISICPHLAPRLRTNISRLCNSHCSAAHNRWPIRTSRYETLPPPEVEFQKDLQTADREESEENESIVDEDEIKRREEGEDDVRGEERVRESMRLG